MYRGNMHCKFFARICLLISSICCIVLIHLYNTSTNIIPHQETPQGCFQKPSRYLPERKMMASEKHLSNVHQYCQSQNSRNWSSLTKAERKLVGRHMIVDDKHGILYCSIPKVACSNWKRVMYVLTDKANSSNSIRKIRHDNFVFLHEFTPLEIERRLKTYFKFVFVREPLERLVSAYNDKFVVLRKYWRGWGRRIVRKYRTGSINNSDHDPSLTEFFKYLLNDSRMNEHWESYVKLCQPCAVSYDFIGSFDCLGRDAKTALEKLHLQNRVQFPLKQKYYLTRKRRTESFDELLARVPPYLSQSVVEKFSQDYEMFSFPKPQF